MTPPTLLLITGVPGSGKSSLARVGADEFGCAVLGHDWTMSGLRALPSVWEHLRGLDFLEFRSVGWTILWHLARAQLREGRSVVLDGVARASEVATSRRVADQEGGRCLVVLTAVDDPAVHRGRIEGRTRDIPHWPELSWSSVQQTLSKWEPPTDVDLVLDTLVPFESSARSLRRLLGAPRRHDEFGGT